MFFLIGVGGRGFIGYSRNVGFVWVLSIFSRCFCAYMFIYCLFIYWLRVRLVVFCIRVVMELIL